VHAVETYRLCALIRQTHPRRDSAAERVGHEQLSGIEVWLAPKWPKSERGTALREKPIVVGLVVHEPDNSTTSHDLDDEFPERTDDSDASVEKNRDGRGMLERSSGVRKTVGVPFGRGDQGGMLGKAGFAAEG
jgi:hypothetical protein